jgi:hypothetical protein
MLLISINISPLHIWNPTLGTETLNADFTVQLNAALPVWLTGSREVQYRWFLKFGAFRNFHTEKVLSATFRVVRSW